MIAVSRDNLERSEVLVAEGDDTQSDIRTSFGFWPETDHVVSAISVSGQRVGGWGDGWVGGWVGGVGWVGRQAWPTEVIASLPLLVELRAGWLELACPYGTCLAACLPWLAGWLQERIHRLTGIPEQFGEGLYGACRCLCMSCGCVLGSVSAGRAAPRGGCRRPYGCKVVSNVHSVFTTLSLLCRFCSAQLSKRAEV